MPRLESSLTCHICGQADDGYLYPLDKAFFYVHKPPTLLVHEEIESIEFCRQGAGLLGASARTFDINIRMRNDQVRPAACFALASCTSPHHCFLCADNQSICFFPG